MLHAIRLKSAFKATGLHFSATVLVAVLVSLLVFAVWYPYPYREFAGGKELFFLVIAADLVCGPLLTFVLFNPSKPKRGLFLDLSIVVVLQLAALAYGLWTVWVARPLFLVHEVDRFKVIAKVDVDTLALDKLIDGLQPRFFKGPQPIGLREATKDEREKVMFESVQSGRDYGERPEFYAPYDEANAAKAYAKAKPIAKFISSVTAEKQSRQEQVTKIALESATAEDQLRFLPIMARQDWIAVLNAKGAIVGYIQGDGF